MEVNLKKDKFSHLKWQKSEFSVSNFLRWNNSLKLSIELFLAWDKGAFFLTKELNFQDRKSVV